MEGTADTATSSIEGGSWDCLDTKGEREGRPKLVIVLI
jgi:hypothetical protein